MKNEIKYCGNCGESNSIENNFCIKCGFSLLSNSQPIYSKASFIPEKENLVINKSKSTIEKTPIEAAKFTPKFQLLFQKLIELNKRNGDINVSCSNYFIHFFRKKKGYKIIMDLGVFDGDDIKHIGKIKDLGFLEESDGSLKKSFIVTNEDEVLTNIIKDTKLIFEKILKIDSKIEFTFQENFEAEKLDISKPQKTNQNAKLKPKVDADKPSWKAGLFILIIIICTIAYCTDSDTADNNVSNQTTSNPTPSEKLKSMETEGKLVGVWYDAELSRSNGSKIGYKFIVSDNKLFVAYCNPDEETLQKNAITTLSALATELIVNSTQYTSAGNPNEYYIINEDEDLLIYDEAGLVVKCKRMFFDNGQN